MLTITVVHDAGGNAEPSVAAWPGNEETCPKCHGQRHVYYLHAGHPGVEVIGGKRVTCPVCVGTGSVRTPLRGTTDRAG
jgi:DnaJ-class molecular chaperone